MSEEERLRWLEQHGQVPDDADEVDWHLAQQTSWWGKPLDPQEFWKGRPIWMGAAELWAANRRGRGYPPLPPNTAKLPRYGGNDRASDPGLQGVEGPRRSFRGTDGESLFWSDFYLANPHPPEILEREQNHLAESIFRSRYLFKIAGNPAGITEELLVKGEGVLRKRAEETGSPPESATDDALFWAYVFSKRKEYEAARASAANNPNDKYPEQILAKSGVDPKFITEPLSDEQLKAANAWKISYLQRLRRNKIDESYIQAYVNAWNLSEPEVFRQPK